MADEVSLAWIFLNSRVCHDDLLFGNWILWFLLFLTEVGIMFIRTEDFRQPQ